MGWDELVEEWGTLLEEASPPLRRASALALMLSGGIDSRSSPRSLPAVDWLLEPSLTATETWQDTQFARGISKALRLANACRSESAEINLRDFTRPWCDWFGASMVRTRDVSVPGPARSAPTRLAAEIVTGFTGDPSKGCRLQRWLRGPPTAPLLERFFRKTSYWAR